MERQERKILTSFATEFKALLEAPRPPVCAFSLWKTGLGEGGGGSVSMCELLGNFSFLTISWLL